ncbi:LysE family translocator [Flagellimonas sp.]|uniref:LysE family translocator n=1 Tax=Flagellimonas sp. TaxID=2058762 RepID=UPI003B50876F
MADIENISLFIGLSWILIITPGPDLIFVLSQGISTGKKGGLISAVGVGLGVFMHTVLATLGIAMVLKASAFVFTVIKMIGAVYLIYLGIKTLLNKDNINVKGGNQISKEKIFVQGFISSTFNPKIAIFFMAFLPQFIRANGEHVSEVPFFVLGVIFTLFSMIFLMVLGYSSGTVAHYLNEKNSISKWTKKISGIVMVLLGIRLMFINQKMI